jgi:hypothetical protein
MTLNQSARVVMACALTLGALAGPARAMVTEPNGLVVPLPVPPVEVGLAGGFNPPAVVSLPALFQARGETLDWQKDALTTPSVFSPLCTFTGELVLHGGACHIDFGWYNVVANRTTPPPDSEIYPIIRGADIKSPWHPGVGETGPTFTTASIRADVNYKGGLIGFALKADQGQDCKQTHFSEQNLNPVCSGGSCATARSWNAAVIWQSTKTPNAYYIGFEDLPMGLTSTGPSDWGTIPGQSLKCDGDFNDFVYFLSGLTCEGGGTPCDTGMLGVCAAGLNECVSGTTLTCRSTLKPGAEACDGLDNDCNGMVDDKAPCPGNQVCDRGVCLPPCGTSEFPCGSGDVCENGLCIEKTCMGMTCPAGKVCKAGTCTGPCDGVTCPRQQVCRIGRCVDPCEGVTCDSDRVCEGGVCVPSCKCRGCGSGTSCAPAGGCLETACMDKTCGAGEVCVAGVCTDRCAGAVCPHGQECKVGACVDIPKPDGGVIVNPDYDAGTSAGAGTSGGSAGGSGTGSGAGGSTGAHEKITPGSGCRCDAGAAPSGGGAPGWFLLGSVILVTARRRRSRRED